MYMYIPNITGPAILSSRVMMSSLLKIMVHFVHKHD